MINVLVVDDDSTFLFLFRKKVEKDPIIHIVKEARHGEEALDWLKDVSAHPTSLPDVIVLDINMPVMDGWQFLDEYVEFAKENGLNIPVCMLSSTINQMDFDKAKLYEPVKHFFTKPFSEKDMEHLKMLKA
jgi:CheY-like chemotaxis protein